MQLKTVQESLASPWFLYLGGLRWTQSVHSSVATQSIATRTQTGVRLRLRCVYTIASLRGADERLPRFLPPRGRYVFSVLEWPPGISALLLIPGYRTARCEQTHSRGPLASPACWGTAFPSAPRSWRCTTGMTLRPLCVATRDEIISSCSHPDAARWKDLGAMPYGFARSGARRVHLVDTEQQGPRPHRAEMLHCVQHDMYKTCIGRPGGTLYIF